MEIYIKILSDQLLCTYDLYIIYVSYNSIGNNIILNSCRKYLKLLKLLCVKYYMP